MLPRTEVGKGPPPPIRPIGEGDTAVTTGGNAKTITAKAVPELKPKTLLTQNTSRMDMMAWERSMQSYFTASNFHLCTPEVQVCYFEERMDQPTSRLLRKLTREEPHKFSIDMLYRMIRESMVRTDSLQQRRITGLLAFIQRPYEPYSTVLYRYDDIEMDCDIESYSIEELRAHIRIAGCTDPKLKEKLLKLGQQESEEPLTLDSIF